MKFAQLDNETILLNEHTYQRISAWRISSARGQIRCPGCGCPLRLVAGVSFEPFFQHQEGSACSLQGMELPPEALKKAVQMEAAAAADEQAQDEPVTVGAFRLPQKRSIAAPQSNAPAEPYRFRKRLVPKHQIEHLTERLAEPLHPEQLRAVVTTEGPLLILAGAGSGKTRVMTARTAHLIRERGVDPRSIMVVTFTTKAADEMKLRLAKQLSPGQARELITGTFHSIFYRMLLHHQAERWDQRRLLKQDWQKRRFLRETGVLQQETELQHLKESELEEALSMISRWKNEYLLPTQVSFQEFAAEEEKRAQTLYPLYEEAKCRHGWFDFDDMLIGCYQLLQDHPEILRRYQERIGYLMIDEFQDINRIQYETVKLLAAPQNNLCVIGDDDQSIYGFRGSDPQYILGFTNDYPQAQSITLEVNYRSRSAIVGLGYSLIGNNRARWKKEFKSFHAEEGENYLFFPEDEEEQASRIVDEISYQLQNGASLGQFAILFRTYESTRPVLERLMDAGIPFQFVHEEESFYEKQAVRWALGYLRLAVNRDDATALRDILATLYISGEQWNALRSQSILDDVPLLDALPRLPQLKGFQRSHLQKVVEILTELPRCSPVLALELIYEDCKLRDYVKKRMKERSDAAADRWSDELQQLLAAAKRHASLNDFLTHVETILYKEKELRKLRPAAEEAIQVLSIHRAKGLEFDTVFLIDLVEGALPHEYALDEARKRGSDAMEEERRLLYVAITRARHTLCIGIPQERFGRKTRASRFVDEMGR